MRLKSKDCSHCVVRSVQHLQSLPITPVYNFHVEVTQTYCVGRQGIVVHNKPS
ncbi:unnamed protein product [Tuwongella immobilis]|uniref:Intein C-terminal splicing domain-containing protein n=1 Tax=Tuwongella immobilis TaxID=692036 RepID=A0A6C2YQW8_9BACT|nr:unnamed protein product [Tuwongella immobilis]VTS04355.1 unnamed protein product [Tuwongella immobilis]